MINLIVWLVVGGVIGWLASIVMKTDAQQGIVLNVVVGIVGAAIGGWFLAPLLGTATINQDNLSISSLVVSLLGVLMFGLGFTNTMAVSALLPQEVVPVTK